MTDERQHTNPPTCTCQYLTVGNRLTTHNAVDSSRCEVHGPLSALRPPTPSVQATTEPPESALPCNLTGLTDDELIGLVLNVPDGPTDVEVRQIIEHVRSEESRRMGQPSTDPRLADLARWIVQEADNQIDSRGQARRDHACAECIPGGEIVIPGFRCALHIAREIDRCTEHPPTREEAGAWATAGEPAPSVLAGPPPSDALLAIEHAVLSASTLEIAQEDVRRIASGRLLPSEQRTANPSPRVSVDAKIWAALVDSIDDVLSTSTTADYDEAATEMERVAGAAKSDASSEQCMADAKCDEHVPLATAIALCTGELDEIVPGSEAGDLRRAFNAGVHACIEAFRQYTPHPKTKEDSNG